MGKNMATWHDDGEVAELVKISQCTPGRREKNWKLTLYKRILKLWSFEKVSSIFD